MSGPFLLLGSGTPWSCGNLGPCNPADKSASELRYICPGHKKLHADLGDAIKDAEKSLGQRRSPKEKQTAKASGRFWGPGFAMILSNPVVEPPKLDAEMERGVGFGGIATKTAM